MRKKRTKHPKLPNGFGTIRYLGEKRSRPYQALGPAEYDKFGNEKRPTVGVAEDWYKAYDLLIEYHDNPYDLDYKNLTFFGTCEQLKPKWLNDVESKKMSKSNYDNLLKAIKKTVPIHKKNVIDIRTRDMQKIIDECELGYTSRGYIKNLCNRVTNYCKIELEMPIKFDGSMLNIGVKEDSTLHIPFTDLQVQTLWNYEGNIYVDILLFSIYTGLRPSEALNLETEKTYIDKNYAIGGSKTKAGKDRFIPFHKAIRHIVRRNYDINNKYLFINPNTQKKISLSNYEKRVKSFLNEIGIDRTPYDTRHTFATKADECKISETIIKILLGHSLKGNVTVDVYIHKDVSLLIEEVNKIYFIKKGVR